VVTQKIQQVCLQEKTSFEQQNKQFPNYSDYLNFPLPAFTHAVILLCLVYHSLWPVVPNHLQRLLSDDGLSKVNIFKEITSKLSINESHILIFSKIYVRHYQRCFPVVFAVSVSFTIYRGFCTYRTVISHIYICGYGRVQSV